MEDKVLDAQYRAELKNKKRIVVKVGTSSLIHRETGGLDLIKVEHLVRELTDLRNKGKDVILVTSGAIGVGRKAAGLQEKPERVSLKQACAAIGQARLMMIYQKFFAEYNLSLIHIWRTRTCTPGRNMCILTNFFCPTRSGILPGKSGTAST